MKQKLLKSFLLLCSLIVGSIALADSVEIIPSDGTAVESANYTITKSPISVDVTASTLTADHIRVFKGQTITISSATDPITKIAFTCTANGTNKYGPGCLSGDGYTASSGATGVWEGSSNSVSLQASTNQCRISMIVVTYGSSGGDVTPTCATPIFSPAAGTYTTAQSVTISTITEGASIYYTIDGTDPTTESTVFSNAITVSANTTIKAIAVKEGNNNSSVATADYKIITFKHAGTAEDPFTVEDAIAAIDAASTISNVYATGIVSEIVTPFNPQFGNISYNISVDGSKEGQQLQAFRGKSFESKWFNTEYDITVGDKVVIYGNLKKYKDTYEFDADNQLISLQHHSIDVTMVDGVNQPYDNFGTRNTGVTPQTFTSNDDSGKAGIVLSAPIIDRAKWWETYCLALKNSAAQKDETVTIKAPKGYNIQSISMTLQAVSSSTPYDVTINGEKATITGAAAKEYKDIQVNDNSFSFTINSTGSSVGWLAVKALTLKLEVRNTGYFVVYVITDMNSNEIYRSNAISVDKGEHITEIPNEYKAPFTEYPDEVDVTIASPLTTITSRSEWVGPLAVGDSYESIVWQNIYINRGVNNYWYLTNSETLPIFVNNPSEKQLASDYYQWGFIGNAYQGFKVYNKATGDAKMLTNGTAVAMEEKEFVWNKIAQNGMGVLIGCADGYLNQSGGTTSTKLALWGSATDQGSTWFVSEVPALAVTNVYYDVVYNGQIVKTAVVPGVQIGDDYPEIPEVLNNGLVDLTADAGTVTEKDQHVQILATAATPFEFSTSAADAKWYNMTIRTDYSVFVDETEPYYPKKTTDAFKASEAYQWAFVGNPYEVSLLNKAKGEGYTLTKVEDVALADGNTKDAAVMRQGTYVWEIYGNKDGFTLREKGTTQNSINQSGGASGPLSFWNSAASYTDDGSTFRVSEVPTSFQWTIGATGYATMNVPVPVTTPEGVQAFTGKINGEYLSLLEVKSNIPANTPVILKAEPGNYYFDVIDRVEILGVVNDLQGTLKDTDAKGKYILAQPEGQKVGFYLADKGTIQAGKAYIVLNANTGPLVKAFYFQGEDATGIANVNVNDHQTSIYNIAGQRISKLQKGFNIVNGKKILF
ncbi:MAG: chitobiase/beta-hexosaminidase C-terminal domain-containing protein [Bacteroidaceae bacterium]|nr:chitobiase/beta-hexosaminidase C-terminal domain-containing protein [Bacteroidaceae bacterium]